MQIGKALRFRMGFRVMYVAHAETEKMTPSRILL